MDIIKDKIDNFFKWVKGTQLVELDSINVKEDPVRPELDLEFRKSYGRKIYGLKFDNEIEGIVYCLYKRYSKVRKRVRYNVSKCSF